MPAQVFTELLARGIRQGHIPNRTKAAREWFRRAARKTKVEVHRDVLADSKDRERTNSVIGRMYIFNYSPKLRATLPYYDIYPVVFPFIKKKGRFTGINFHYLPYPQRAVLMDRLYELRTDDRYDERTKLRLSYEILNETAKYKYFKPCIHTYLTNHVRSRLILVDSADWDTAIFLPIQEWRKATQSDVWRDSRTMVGLKRERRPTK